MSQANHLTVADVLRRYEEELLPEFDGLSLSDPNQVGNFGNRPLHVAAVRGLAEELQALLSGGADVNARGEHGCTPLHYAVGQQNIDAIKLLLQHGASPTLKDVMGRTAFDVAKSYGRDDIAKLLIG